MSAELDAMHSLGRALKSAGEGKGLARSAVEELPRAGPLGREGARLLLLGFPLSRALKPLVEEGGEEVSMLASLVVAAPRSSAPLVGRSGESLAVTLEGWVKSRDSEVMEQKVMRFRSLVTSAVLGAVMGMLTALGPVVGSLGLGGSPVGTGALVYGSAAMTAMGSGMLGAFMSGRRFFVNVLLSMAVFAAIAAAAAPLASVSSAAL
ncbi:MAG: hypothetical protein JRN11_05910 [Nitrososphaerota archaeon]|nr:hypothetical protein [Nitrososphaerota archaeon]MDG7013185.1 hypothetical protein [Nitrososphaerota archaeon]MDG7026266.1 hypothetical protein [Nitrososphaerota archaeon]